MKKFIYIALTISALITPTLSFAIATSTSYQVEDDRPVAGGGRQSSDSYTNIASLGQAIVPARATSTSYLADFGMAFWNAGSAGTLTVTDSSDNAMATDFTISYSSADPDSPLFMVCSGTVQADVDASCTGTATRAFTSAFSYEVTGLLNNTVYYFKVYPLSGYDASGNPIISPRSSNTASSSRAVGTVFMPVSGGSGSGSAGGFGGAVSAPSGPSVPSSPITVVLPTITPSVFERVTDFIASMLGIGGESANPVASAPSVTQVARSVSRNPVPVSLGSPAAMPSSPVPFQTASIEGAIFTVSGARSVPVAGTKITLYKCPSPSARPSGCSIWHPAQGQSNSAISDSKGAFSFAAPAGIYYFHVAKFGYEVADSEPFPLASVSYTRIDMKPVSLWKKLFGWF